jgi:cob(I)alamin adenosyltransferase
VFDVNGALVTELESWIDELDESLPPLRNFILPVGLMAEMILRGCWTDYSIVRR